MLWMMNLRIGLKIEKIPLEIAEEILTILNNKKSPAKINQPGIKQKAGT